MREDGGGRLEDMDGNVDGLHLMGMGRTWSLGHGGIALAIWDTPL
jgi:hypothetical protein